MTFLSIMFTFFFSFLSSFLPPWTTNSSAFQSNQSPNQPIHPSNSHQSDSTISNMANKTTGRVELTIPKDTLAVMVSTSDAGYYQAVTVKAGDGIKTDSFQGTGTGSVPMSLKSGASEYLKIEPSSTERKVTLNFHYTENKGDDNWEDPIVLGPSISQYNGVRVVNFGTEDSTDNSFQ
ncbi:hypothetical protein F5Y16DRAFT_168771 [Xylariaceae sp. FL0255]|nr:hypothetical protein F5Y16DRAFT_168771 [Xylariaceae sp. FL0255]